MPAIDNHLLNKFVYELDLHEFPYNRFDVEDGTLLVMNNSGKKMSLYFFSGHKSISSFYKITVSGSTIETGTITDALFESFYRKINAAAIHKEVREDKIEPKVKPEASIKQIVIVILMLLFATIGAVDVLMYVIRGL